MKALRVTLLLTLILLPFVASTHLQAAPALTLETSTTVATEGYLSFSWWPPDADKAMPAMPLAVYLQVARDNRFNSVFADYPLLGQSRVSISGLEDGEYFSRLVGPDKAPLSNVATFKVQHRDLHTAWLLFSLGAVMFVLLVVAVLRLSHQRNQ